MTNSSVSCIDGLNRVKVMAPGNICLLTLLTVIDIIIVFGNLLVILAVIRVKSLRSINSYLITSLAVADCCLGLLVLPFSITNEILGSWIFDTAMCQIWLQVDILLCTASIMNLVVISVDRFIAISLPLRYRALITPERGVLMITSAWVVSLLTCLPSAISNLLEIYGRSPDSILDKCACTPMNNTPAYIVYSALVSFYIPMIVIIAIYIRIFTIAQRVANTTCHGTLPMIGSITPRIHRQKGSKRKAASAPNKSHSPSSVFTTNKSKVNAEEPDSAEEHLTRSPIRARLNSNRASMITISQSGKPEYYRLQSVNGDAKINDQCCDNSSVNGVAKGIVYAHSNSVNSEQSQLTVPIGVAIARGSAAQFVQGNSEKDDVTPQSVTPTPSSLPFGNLGFMTLVYRATTNLRRHTRKRGNRLNRLLTTELKAAKTVAIVTGCFIICWIGFAVCYILRAFPFCRHSDDPNSQESCVPENVFSVVFWLGYMNSACNPMIYAVFNKTYRKAFKRLLTFKHMN